MDLLNPDDTIAAISSGAGLSAIAIVRLSGPSSLAIGDEIFVGRRGARPPSSWTSHTIRVGHIVEGAHPQDQVLLAVMRKPATYTREDIVEIHCHGGVVAARRVLDLLLRKGARLAGPGEFTLRAFLNGRIDLTQAEAVNRLIRATTEGAHEMALRHLSGALSEEMARLDQGFVQIRATLEAAIEFPEDVASPEAEGMARDMKDLLSQIARLIERSKAGQRVAEGVRLVIVGRPNVGKSSLLNRLVGKDRAIVHAEPGTTRDLVEGTAEWDGIRVTITDTAGIRGETQGVESMGIDLARRAADEADLLLAAFDASQVWTQDDEDLCRRIAPRKGLIALNKMDLPRRLHEASLQEALPGWPILDVSCLTGQGIDRLRESVSSAIWDGAAPDPSSEILVSEARHVDALRRSREALARASGLLQEGHPLDLVAVELRDAHEALGEISGKVTPEGVLDAIFSRFCVGK